MAVDAAWKQRVIDWERRDRNARCLARHLRLCDLPAADRAVILTIHAHGERAKGREEEETPRSVLRATMKHLGQLAGISPSAVHKAKDRLLARGVLGYAAPWWTVSWNRVWGLRPVLPEVDCGSPSTPIHAHPRPNQERRKKDPPDPKDQETKNQCAPVRACAVLKDLVAAGPVDEGHELRLERLGRRILGRVRPIEATHAVEPGDRLQLATARRIADGMCAGDSDVNDELEAVFASMGRRPQFTQSPAAYLVACAQRRGWIRRAEG